METLNALEQLIELSLTQHQVVHLQKLTVACLQNISATLLHKKCNAQFLNKQIYIATKLSGEMLKLAVKFGCVSDMLYIAMFYYKTYKYTKAVNLLKMAKANLSRPYLMYNEHADSVRYLEAVGEKSWATKRKQAVACDISIICKITSIDELKPVCSTLGIPIMN